jgi:Zn-dependent alcohol dehydrogenase
VLVGIPRADAEVALPALSIPRLERRILGSIYGSSRPERDFPRILELYRSGRLPLDRLVSHRLPLDEVAEAFRLMGSGDAIRVVLDLHATSRPEGGSAMHQEPAGGRRSRNGGG